MDRVPPRCSRLAFSAALALALAAVAGCDPAGNDDYWVSPGTVTEDAQIMRRDARGPILVVFCDHPLDPKAPPDGVRRAALEVAAQAPTLSAAAFYRGVAERGEQWLNAEISRREFQGESPRVILAGAGLAATAASEAAWRVLRNYDRVTVDLLVTVDAVKAGAVARTTGMATAAIKSANPIPGTRRDTIAYEGAPRPDGIRLRAHTNYYQTDTALLHGAPMPGATVNQRIVGPRHTVNHGNVDDYAYPMIRADFERALWGRVGRLGS